MRGYDAEGRLTSEANQSMSTNEQLDMSDSHNQAGDDGLALDGASDQVQSASDSEIFGVLSVSASGSDEPVSAAESQLIDRSVKAQELVPDSPGAVAEQTSASDSGHSAELACQDGDFLRSSAWCWEKACALLLLGALTCGLLWQFVQRVKGFAASAPASTPSAASSPVVETKSAVYYVSVLRGRYNTPRDDKYQQDIKQFMIEHFAQEMKDGQVVLEFVDVEKAENSRYLEDRIYRCVIFHQGLDKPLTVWQPYDKEGVDAFLNFVRDYLENHLSENAEQ